MQQTKFILSIVFLTLGISAGGFADEADTDIEYPLIPGHLEESTWGGPFQIYYSKNWDEFRISDLRTRSWGNILANDSATPDEIRLVKTKKGNSTIWVPAEAIYYRHINNYCRFQYQLEIKATENGILLRDRFPRGSHKDSNGRCTFDASKWYEHSRYYYASYSYLPVYKNQLSREKDPTKRAELELFIAVWKGDRAAIETLAKNGVSLTAKDDRGRTPLVLAATSVIRPPTIPLLRSLHDYTDEEIEAALPYAMNTDGRVLHPQIRLALVTEPFNQKGWSKAIDQAARLESPKNILALLKYANESEISVVEAAAEAFAKRMLQKFAVDLKRWDEMTTVVEEFNRLLGVDHKVATLFMSAAIRTDHWDFFWKLVDAGANPDFHYKYNENLYVPVHYAALLGNLEFVKRLEAKGIDPCAVKGGENALSGFITKGSMEGIQYLTPKCDLHAGLGPKAAPAHIYAASKMMDSEGWKNTAQAIELFLKKSPNPNTVDEKDNEGNTVMDRFCLSFAIYTSGFTYHRSAEKKFFFYQEVYKWLRDSWKAPLAKGTAPSKWVF